MENETMTVIGCTPGECARIIQIPKSLKGMQEYVGGFIEAVYPFEDPIAIICNEEGKINGMELNRALYTEEGEIFDIVAGRMFICGIGEEDFQSIPDSLQQKYLEKFQEPEVFIRIGNDIRAIKVPEDITQKQTENHSQHIHR